MDEFRMHTRIDNTCFIYKALKLAKTKEIGQFLSAIRQLFKAWLRKLQITSIFPSRQCHITHHQLDRLKVTHTQFKNRTNWTLQEALNYAVKAKFVARRCGSCRDLQDIQFLIYNLNLKKIFKPPSNCLKSNRSIYYLSLFILFLYVQFLTDNIYIHHCTIGEPFLNFF